MRRGNDLVNFVICCSDVFRTDASAKVEKRSLEFDCVSVYEWLPLVWSVRSSDSVAVQHGACVEAAKCFAREAAWPGAYMACAALRISVDWPTTVDVAG